MSLFNRINEGLNGKKTTKAKKFKKGDKVVYAKKARSIEAYFQKGDKMKIVKVGSDGYAKVSDIQGGKIGIEVHVDDLAPLKEEMSAAAANITTGSNTDMQNPLNNAGKIKRESFNNCEVFEVDSEYYHRCTQGKKRYSRYEKYVGNGEVGEAIRQYGRSNPKKSIIVKDGKTGAMQYLKRH